MKKTTFKTPESKSVRDVSKMTILSYSAQKM